MGARVDGSNEKEFRKPDKTIELFTHLAYYPHFPHCFASNYIIAYIILSLVNLFFVQRFPDNFQHLSGAVSGVNAWRGTAPWNVLNIL